jgi:two-component system sensor histidine kinase UhpB
LLDDLGLVPALEWYASQRLGRQGVQTKVIARGTAVRLSPTVETILFRIGQEALTNAAKYSRATRVTVSLDFENEIQPPSVTMTIKDNGCGFNWDATCRTTRSGRPFFGLLGIQERVSLVEGVLEIDSTPDKGTTIRATVPLCERETEKVLAES